MSLILSSRPWDSQPQGDVRLAERFSWPGSIAFTPSVGVLGGAGNTRVDITTGGTPAGLGARAATTSGRIDLGPVTRIGTGGATWVMTLRRTGTSLRYAHGTLDDGSSYIEQIMVNSLAGEATSAGNVGLYYRTEAGLTRAAGTTSAPLQINQAHTVVFQITSPTTWAIFIDGVEQAVSYSGSATLTAQSGVADYSLFLCNRHNRATLTGGATDVDVVSFGRFPSNDIDIAAVSANPWLMFEPRRIWVPVSAGGSSVSLIVADATHAHAADGLVLTSSTALSVAEATHAHAADSITLVAGSVLTVAEASHAHAADSLTLTAAFALAVADATHAHAADAITLSVAGATNLTVADALHSHAADALALTSAHALIVADATHAHTVDGLTLTAASVLAIQEALHAHAADVTVLTMDSALAVAETSHAQVADNLVLGVAGTANLVVADAAHAHSAAVIALTSAHALVVASAIHNHSVEGLALSVASVLAIQEALHAHAAENLALETAGSAVLLLANSLHAHTSDGAALTVDAWLVAADAAHGHSADNVVFTFGGAIPTDTLPMMVPLQNSYMLVAPERSLMIVRV